MDGKIKAWLYDVMGSRVDYDAPGRSCTTMAYSADGKRLVIRPAIASKLLYFKDVQKIQCLH